MRFVVAVSVFRQRRLFVLVRIGEPLARSFAFARRNLEEGFLNPLGDFTAAACADLNFIDGANRSDFGGCAGEEEFVRNVERGALYARLYDRNIQLAANLYNAVASDAGQDGG